MKRRLILIFSLLFSFICVLKSQVNLIASGLEGCDSLRVEVFIEPQEVYDTVTSVTWRVNEEITSSGDSLNLHLKNPGSYSVKATINNDYEISLDQKINVFASPNVDFVYADTTVSDEFSYVFRSTAQEVDSLNYTYSWSVNGEEVGFEPVIIYSFNESGEYTVGLSIENDAGCSNSFFKDILISELLQCPNVFTPNMDGHNDFFTVKTDGNTIYDFRVYSRSGLKIYRTESPTIFWDGRSLSGIEMQPGIYYYTIEPVNNEASEEKSGFVHLFR